MVIGRPNVVLALGNRYERHSTNRNHALRAAAQIGAKAKSSQIRKSYLMEHRVATTIERYEHTAFITPG